MRQGVFEIDEMDICKIFNHIGANASNLDYGDNLHIKSSLLLILTSHSQQFIMIINNICIVKI